MSGISERRTCPSFPAHGRHVQPRALTNHTGPAATRTLSSTACEPPDESSGRLRPYCSVNRSVGARPRRRSVTWPCVCPSAQNHLVLERIARSAHKKRPASRYSPRDRSSFPIDGQERAGASWTAPAVIMARGACSTGRQAVDQVSVLGQTHTTDAINGRPCRKPPWRAARSLWYSVGRTRWRRASDVPCPLPRAVVRRISALPGRVP